MLSHLQRSERARLESEIDEFLRRSGADGRDPAGIESLAREFDRGVNADAGRPKLWAALLRRRAICLRTALATG
jgi:hypothetical protein